MKTAFLIHGSYGHPENNWFPWLKTKLIEQGWNVIVPKFPTPEGQNLPTWMEVFEPYLPKLDDQTIMIGHSLAPAFILSILEKIDRHIVAAFMVAGFTGLLNDSRFDPIIHTFTEKNFNWPKIHQNCPKFYLFHSDNDPFVPLAKGQELAKSLGSELVTIPNAGHFNTDAKYFKFPQLLEQIENLKL